MMWHESLGDPVYHVIACHVLWREICYFASLSPHTHQFTFLKQGLHNTPDLLRSELQAAIDRADERTEAILIGYGLCSNGLVGIRARNKKLVVMRGHDCITFLLGSKERYREYFDSHPGTYWYSPGWIETSVQPGKDRYELVRKHYVEIYGEENAEYLMNASENWMQNYNNAAYVDLGIGDSERYKQFTRDCAQWLGWKADFLQGDARLMRDFLAGNWNDRDFLIVEPGCVIVPAHDETIVASAPAHEEAEGNT